MNKRFMIVIAATAASPWAASAATLGATAETAAFSAKQVLENGASLGDGLYWIDPDGAGGDAPFQIFGDMTSSGGGWTLGLVSRRNDKAASANLIDNTGTAGPNSTHTRDLTELAIDQNAQIRHVIRNNGQTVFDGYYTGNYHGTFAADASAWTVVVGNAGIFSYHFGMPWSTEDNDQDNNFGNCALFFGAWYHNNCFYSHPAAADVNLGGPYADPFGYVDQWQVFVRETTTPPVGAVPAVPLPAGAPLLLAGLATLALLRRRVLKD